MASLVLAFSSVAFSQDYIRNGNEYSAVQSTSEFKDENTGFVWKDKSGKTYEIFITKRNACYIWRTSKKSGKQYKYYLPKEVEIDIAKQLGREIKENE